MRNIIIVDYDRRSITIAGEDELYIHVALEIGVNRIEGRLPMSVTITATQKIRIRRVKAVDAKGNDARLDGPVVWQSSNEASLRLDPPLPDAGPDAPPVIAAVGPIGVGQISVRGDADLGEGVRHIAGMLDIEVIAGEAVALVIETEAPEEQ